MQLGHQGSECSSPREPVKSTLVMDVSGIQKVSYRYCDCGAFASGPEGQRRQLEQIGWYPPANIGSCDPPCCVTLPIENTYRAFLTQEGVDTALDLE